MSSERAWQMRSPHRLPDGLWTATLNRVRGEFDEMPGMRLTSQQAESLLGLPDPVSTWVLDRLSTDGFLARTPQGEYMRRNTAP